MCEQREITVTIPVEHNAHGCEVSAAMRRVGELCQHIASRRPHSWYGLGRAIASAETAVKDCNYAEVEFAAYLAGLAVEGDK